MANFRNFSAPLHGRRAFTLLELLVSMTIIAVMVVLVFGALRISVRAWEKGEADIEANQRGRIVLDLIKRQIASLTLKSPPQEAGQTPVFIKGDSTSLVFTSRVSLAPGEKYGLTYVKYLITEKKNDMLGLSFYEKYAVFSHGQDPFLGLEEEDFYELIPSAKQIGFEYFSQPDAAEEGQWVETWDPETQEGIPGAIRISFQQDETAPRIQVIARLVVEDKQ